MPDAPTCSECGTPIPQNSSEGFCPKCLLGLADTVAMEEGAADRRAHSLDLPSDGSVFGNYELLERIGEGGMGIVFKARQRELNRIVALKMIRSGPLANDNEVRRFRSEAQTASRLQHPNLVTVHEVGEQAGQLFFSMDYVEGENLAQAVRDVPLPAERASRYVKTIAEAVHYAHQRGILHRDLKPANVLIDADERLRITDFGLAKQLNLGSGLTASGAILGTPSYIPPEQAAGQQREVGPASDVYSLGAILYDLLTGRPPFRAESPVDTVRQVVDNEPAPPRMLNRKVPQDLETICLKCLAKEPRQRYGSAQHLADDLQRFLNGEPIHARPIGYVGRFWLWGRRNPALASSMGLVLLLFGLIGVAAILFRHEMIEAIREESLLAAEVIAHELATLQAEVEWASKTSQLPSLASLVETGNTNALRDHLEQLEAVVEGRQLHWMDTTNVFESWSVFDTKGTLLARWPSAETTWTNDFIDRDHHESALLKARDTGVATPHVSLAFRSRTDKRMDKFGISIGLKVPGRTKELVVGTLLATVATAPSFRRQDIKFNAVLIAEADASDGSPHERFMIMSHPAFLRSDDAILLEELPLMPDGSSGLYVDPAAKVYPKYAGFWLASGANIPNSPFTLVIQRRDRIIDALGTAALAALFGAVSVLFWWVFRRTKAA